MRGFQNGSYGFRLWVPKRILIAGDNLAFRTQQLGTRASSARRRQQPSSSSSAATQSLLAAIVESSAVIWMKDHHCEFQRPKKRGIQRMAALFLGRQGHSVTAATDGAAALIALAEQDFDVILMDVQMPIRQKNLWVSSGSGSLPSE
jgi:CheY-like chemotaxis protein